MFSWNACVLTYPMLEINHDMCRLLSEILKHEVEMKALTDQLASKACWLKATKSKVLSNIQLKNI